MILRYEGGRRSGVGWIGKRVLPAALSKSSGDESHADVEARTGASRGLGLGLRPASYCWARSGVLFFVEMGRRHHRGEWSRFGSANFSLPATLSCEEPERL